MTTDGRSPMTEPEPHEVRGRARESTRAASRAYFDRLQRRPFVAAWQGVATATLLVTVLGGMLVRLTDAATFGSIWEGMWWAAQTVTTVGYGDVLPESALGRLVAVLVMMVGVAFLTVTTAAIASLFAESTRRRIARQREDPVHVEVERLHERLDEVMAELRMLRGAGGEPSDEARS
jgi:voltage-gated potassium channel